MSENSSGKTDSSKWVSRRAWSVAIEEWKFSLTCSSYFRCLLWLVLNDTDIKPTSARRATGGLSFSAKTILSLMALHDWLDYLCSYWRRWALPWINFCRGIKWRFFRSSFMKRSTTFVAGFVVICSKKLTFVRNG